MRKRAQKSNHNFMLGTFVLGVLVICIVILFTTLAFNIDNKHQPEQEPSTLPDEEYRFIVNAGFYPTGCSIYFNDSLLYSGTVTTDTSFSIMPTSEENAIIVVDNMTDQIQIANVPKEIGTFKILQDDNGLYVSEE